MGVGEDGRLVALAEWIAVKEAVTGYRSVPVVEPEVTAVGAAMLAATALGWEPDPARALSEPDCRQEWP